MRILASVCLAALIAASPALAAPITAPAPSPATSAGTGHAALQLVAHNMRTDRAEDVDEALKISRLDLSVDIVGHMAQMTLLVTFANPTGDRLEGDLSIDLPLGASVSAYALDVDGVMTEGVLMPKLEAREVYEESLRRGVDPGLGEVVGNTFRTHVFPILPGSGRTVRIVYVSSVGPDGRLELPLTMAEGPGATHISVVAHDMVPQVSMPGLDRPFVPVAAAAGDTRFDLSLDNKAQLGNLVVSGLKPNRPVALSRHSNGERFFELTVAAEPEGAVKAKAVRLYWDASRSRRGQDTTREAGLLAAYVARTQPKSLDIVLFSDGAPQVVHFDRPTADAVRHALAKVTYSGATRFTGLRDAIKGRADVCILVTDGQMTLDSFAAGHWPCRVMTLSSAPTARRDVLKQLSARNGGSYVDLAALDDDKALRMMTLRAPSLSDVTGDDGESLDYTVAPLGDDLYQVVGAAPRGDSLTLDYDGDLQTIDQRRTPIAANDAAGVTWGMTRIDALNATDAPDRDKVLALARQYHVATPDVSFLVLESGRAFAQAHVAPPTSASKDILADYTEERDRLAALDAEKKAGRLEDITTQWQDQKDWWAEKPLSLAEAKRTMTKKRPVPPQAMAAEFAPPPSPTPAPPPVIQPRLAPAPAAMAPAAPEPSYNTDEEAVVVTGVRRETPVGVESEIKVVTAQWDPDRPYLKPLKAVKAGNRTAFEQVYSDQEKAFGDTPAFYFDMAEWMYRNGMADGAAAVARNALDLPDSDLDSQIILAGRLLRYGDFDDALWLDEHIARATPDKPQAARNLALALIETTDKRLKSGAISQDKALDAYERALGLLSDVVLNTWNRDYDGIEIIALTEANHLIARLKAMDVSDDELEDVLPKSLVALLDVDVRITLEWNTDKTDMDLWVDEPSGERAIYNNPKTMLGGRLSNDQTRGYGPEEYLLHYAPSGNYDVLVNVYASDVLNRNGATSVTVHLYRNWGRKDEKEESFVIELQKDQSGAVPVGSFKRD